MRAHIAHILRRIANRLEPVPVTGTFTVFPPESHSTSATADVVWSVKP